MNVLLDTNVVLDVLLARQPWLADSQRVWQACDDGRITGYLLASTFTDIYYVARKLSGKDVARQSIELCLLAFTICPLDRIILENALQLTGADFEDDVQLAAALHLNLDALVTRNVGDFTSSPIPILTPAALMTQLTP